ncbi:putative Sterol desaturase [Pseudomonas chlororaphis]|uniref:Sterol desaturase family protein n=1 Tax=Pseudomonas chlororaphis subsp. aurantiaca TaxID=86192 RepID=A0AAJ0ZJ58_9PSED|nr:sterol desaturase family protein [Pseudomonas chlororaphis]MBU4633633.1 sterol desaturase family protein [Pseudomonas chlororaphis subsp. aurantiaca]
MKTMVKGLYGPAFFAGFIGAGVWVIGTPGLAPGWLLLVFAGALGVSFLAEWWLPYEVDWNRPQQDRLRDVLHALVNESLNALGLLLLPGLVSLLAFDGLWPRGWSLWAQLALAIVVADCGLTLAHYFSHRLSWLWRLHAVHHSVQRLYGFNGLMKHPLHQLLEASAGLLPLLFLGVPLPVAQLLAFAIAIQLLLQHSNVDMRPGPLGWVFAWAPMHRFHHMKYGTAGNVNFGLFLNVWDWLLGTAFYSSTYPIRQGDLGIGSQPDYPQAYWRQLLAPFSRQAVHEEPPVPLPLRR